MKQIELVERVPDRVVAPVRSLVVEFGLGCIQPRVRRRKREVKAEKIAKALTAAGVTLDKLVAACHESAKPRVFTPADASDLAIFGNDYSI